MGMGSKRASNGPGNGLGMGWAGHGQAENGLGIGWAGHAWAQKGLGRIGNVRRLVRDRDRIAVLYLVPAGRNHDHRSGIELVRQPVQEEAVAVSYVRPGVRIVDVAHLWAGIKLELEQVARAVIHGECHRTG